MTVITGESRKIVQVNRVEIHPEEEGRGTFMLITI